MSTQIKISTLVVDGKGTACEWDELLWSFPPFCAFSKAVISAPRPARELLRVLILLDRLVKDGGTILIHPTVSQDSSETRAEATEIFCGAYPHWKRRLVEDKIVELRKLAGAAVREPSPPLGAVHPAPAGRRIVSLALFGDPKNGYWDKAVTYALAHHALFPGWELWLHVDEHLFHAPGGGVLCRLGSMGHVKIVYVPSKPTTGKCERMLWRMLPLWDESVDYVLCRDVDSLPTWRERCAVEEFVASGHVIGVLHDDPMHAGLMGGLTHFDARQFRAAMLGASWQEFINSAGWDDSRWGEHGADQDHLNATIAPLMPSILEHSVFVKLAEDGETRVYRQPTWPQSDFRTEIAEFDDASVSHMVKAHADEFINYMGAASYRHSEARDFYVEHSPITDAAQELERGNRIALLSVDTNPDYAFYLPLTVLTWRERNYRALVTLVGEPNDWLSDPHLSLAVKRAREAGADLYWTPAVEGVRTSTVAQLARIFPPAGAVQDDEILITSDMDMWPVGKWVGNCDDLISWAATLHILYANAYEQTYPHWPMCYVAGRAFVWREVLNGATLGDALGSAPKDTEGAWNHDERWLGEKIDAFHTHHPNRVRMIDRDMRAPGQARIDRSNWNAHVNEARERCKDADTLAELVADAHLPRPGFGEAWKSIYRLLDLMLDNQKLAWAENYHDEWMKAAP